MKPKRHVFLTISVVFISLLAIAIAYAVISPNRELVFRREANSPNSLAILGDAIHYTANWPLYHHSAIEVKRLDQEGNPLPEPQQQIEKGALVRLIIEPKRQKWKQFTLVARVLDYQRNSSIELELLSDTTRRLTQIFNPLVWRIELKPRPDGQAGTRVIAEIRGQTLHWRSRFFGTISKNILMNQVFYVNFPKFLELNQLARTHNDPEDMTLKPLESSQ